MINTIIVYLLFLPPTTTQFYSTKNKFQEYSRQHSTSPIFFSKYIVGPQIDEHKLLLKLLHGKGIVKSPHVDSGYSKTIFSENQ